jgi:hypothetical protein
MSLFKSLVTGGLVPALKESHGFSITIEDVETGASATVTAYHGTGDFLGAVDEKQERNFGGILVSELAFEPLEGARVTDENGDEGMLLKARRTNHGTWELQVWRTVERA